MSSLNCPTCKKDKVDMTSYSDGLNWVHCEDCGWIDPTTDKPEVEGDWI